MKRIICLLAAQGMDFNVGTDTKDSANKYIKYNTSWNMLKQSRNILHLNNPSTGKYSGISFFEMRTAGLVHYYFNQAIENVVKEFEHCLKVYISNVYESSSSTEKNNVIKKLQFINFSYNKQDIKLNENNVFELYSFATLSELLKVYKIIKSKVKSVNMPKIDSKISNIRNTIYHHNNILIENKENNNPNVDVAHVMELTELGLSEDITSYMSINYQYNTLRLIVDMIIHVNFFLSQDMCTDKRRKYMMCSLKEDLKLSEKYYNKLKPKSWANNYYRGLYIIIDHFK